jgi:hypothetical protein
LRKTTWKSVSAVARSSSRSITGFEPM